MELSYLTNIENIEEMIDEHGYINWTLLGGEIISIDTIAKLYNQSKQDKKYLEHLKDGIEKYKELLSRVNKKINHIKYSNDH